MEKYKNLPSKPNAAIGALGGILARSGKGWKNSPDDKWRWWILRESQKLEFMLAFKYSSKNIKYYEKTKIKKLVQQKKTISLNQFIYRVNCIRKRLGLKQLSHP